METIIEINNLVKNYPGVEAVKGISLNINKGEMFGLVGPDGAGKTSTIRVLCGLIPHNGGEVTMLNKDIVKERKQIQKHIGYLSQKFSLYTDLTIDENIEFFADIHNVKDYHKRRDELLEFTRLTKFRKRLAGRLSGGMKQKLALACSLIHKPDILFLDEPTTGVDPVSRRDFWKILYSLLAEGITIFMTTPYLDEAERCTRVAMMNKGKIIALNTPDNIKKETGKIILEIVCSNVRPCFELIKNKLNPETQMFGDRLNILINSKNDVREYLTFLEQNDVQVESYRTLTPSLENVFISKMKN